jgi:hypothetical protein
MLRTVRNLLLSAVAALVMASSLIAPQPAEAGAMSNYIINKDIDYILRAQTFTAPATVYVALATTTGTAAACGTEVTGGSYARVAVTSGLTAWAGTQAAGSTSISSGTSGQTSNNAVITFAAPTANWGTVTSFCVFDAPTAGNLLLQAALTTAKTINNADAAPSFAIAALTWTISSIAVPNSMRFDAANDEYFDERRRA